MASENARGAGFMVGAMVVFTASDACLKVVAGEASAYQVAFWRNILVVAIFALVAWRTGAFAARPGRAAMGWMAARGAAEAFIAFCYITALFRLPLANATAILQATPLLMTAAGAVLLGERVGPRRWAAVLIGLAGVLIIVRPGLEGFDANTLWPLGAVLGVTARDIVTRRIPGGVPTVLVTGSTALTVMVFGGLAGGTVLPVMGAPGWAALTLSGLLVTLAYACSVLAMRYGEASFTAPFRYTGVISAAIIGWLFFGEVPDAATVAGTVVVCAAGLYALRRQGARPPALERRGTAP